MQKRNGNIYRRPIHLNIFFYIFSVCIAFELIKNVENAITKNLLI